MPSYRIPVKLEITRMEWIMETLDKFCRAPRKLRESKIIVLKHKECVWYHLLWLLCVMNPILGSGFVLGQWLTTCFFNLKKYQFSWWEQVSNQTFRSLRHLNLSYDIAALSFCNNAEYNSSCCLSSHAWGELHRIIFLWQVIIQIYARRTSQSCIV